MLSPQGLCLGSSVLGILSLAAPTDMANDFTSKPKTSPDSHPALSSTLKKNFFFNMTLASFQFTNYFFHVNSVSSIQTISMEMGQLHFTYGYVSCSPVEPRAQ